MNKIKQFFLPEDGHFHKDFFSGLTVALALIPEAIAFALVAHVQPFVGLYAAFFMCFLTAVLGGRPGMISGATGSMAIVMVALVSKYGINYLFATVVLTGLLQILIGGLGLGKLIRIMPKPVMVGFVNGLAIVIFLAQLEQFKYHSGGQLLWLHGSALWMMIGLVFVAMMITHYLPKFVKALPSALIAIITVSLVVHFMHLDARVVEDMMQGHSLANSLPHFHMLSVPITMQSMAIILSYAVILCIIGLSESLMTLSLIDEMTHTRGKANKECVAQGIGNVVSGFFGSMGGCAMIGQSMINIRSGGRGRLSGITAGVALLLFILVFWSFIKLIPLAALVGVMFMVVIETFEWATFKFIRKIPFHDALVIVTVTAVTVFTDLAVAVVVGIIMSSLVFAWETAKKIHAKTSTTEEGAKEYMIEGPLFFASTSEFKGLFDYSNDPVEVIIDFKYSRVADHSAIDAIKSVTENYMKLNKKVHLRHLSEDCRVLLEKAGSMVEANVMEDPNYQVVTDAL